MKKVFTVALCTLGMIFGLLAQDVTFSKDIYPIISKHCLNCHYKGGPTPFPLTNYKEVSKKATFIAFITKERIMPPWKANPNYVHFKNERIMSDSEIDLLSQWIDGGLKKGERIRKGRVISSREKLGKPGLKLMMPEKVVVPGSNQNLYLCYKLPYELDKDTFAYAFEFVPGNTEVLHHASFQILKVDESAEIFSKPYQRSTQSGQILDEGAFYKILNLQGENGVFPEVVYTNSWLPGSSIQIYPKDLGFRIPKKGVIFFNFIHYSPTSIEQTDLSGLNIYFSDQRPKKIMKELLFKPNFKGNEGVIPKDSVKTIKFKKYIREDMLVHTIIPHMHRLGKYFKTYAVDPSGDTIPLVEVMEWDFYWQEYYHYPETLLLKKGSLVYTEAIFDNTENNLSNPSHPPIDVYFEESMEEDSEMLHLIFLYTDKVE